jgi:hypothetical protein
MTFETILGTANTKKLLASLQNKLVKQRLSFE